MLRSPPARSILSRATQLARQPRASSAVRLPAASAAAPQEDEAPYYPIKLAIFLAGARTKSSTRVLNVSPSLTNVASGTSSSSSSTTTVNTERQSSKMVRKFEPATGWKWVEGEEDYDEHYQPETEKVDQEETFFGVKGEGDGARQQFENEVSWAALRRTSSRSL